MKGVVFCLLLCGVIVKDGRGQSVVATVQGVVTDSSKAVIRNAKLTLTSLDEDTTSTAESGRQGFYQFLNLKPGWYQIVAECEGFAAVQTPEFLVGAREARRADLTLAVAPPIQSMEVRATVPLINTENGMVSDMKRFEQIIRLPTNFRFDGSYLSIVPGVQGDGGLRHSVGGGLPAQTDYTIDGISNVDIRRFGPLGAPSPEILGELRVTSVGAGAAYASMSDVTISTKSGGNQLHGSLLWYHQNSASDATPYGFLKSPKVFNDFGASAGGPVILPTAYDGHNRTFFFAVYEGTRRPRGVNVQRTLPTAAMRDGYLDGVAGPVAIDPVTGGPFPGNRIPLTSISPVTRRLLDRYYPLPNHTAASGTVNYSVPARSDAVSDRYDIRLDHVIGAGQRVTVRWGRGRYDLLSPNFVPLPFTRVDTTTRTLNVSHIYSPNARLSNEARAGINLYNGLESFPIVGRDAVTDLGLAGLDLRNTGNMGGFPVFNLPPPLSSIGRGRETDDQSRTYQFADTLTMVHGAHILNFGADLRRIGYRSALFRTQGDDFGTYSFFDNFYTRNGFADFLLGVPAQTQYAVLGPNINQSSTHAAVFAQDNWRATPRLAFQIGLRWEVHPPMNEDAGNIATFDHSTGALILPDQTVSAAPGLLTSIKGCPAFEIAPCTAVLTASQAGLPQTLRRTDYRGWGPRIGFAWQPRSGGRTVVRASAGIYTQTLRGPVARAIGGAHSSDVRTIDNSFTSGGQPNVKLPNILPAPDELGRIGIQDFSGIDPNLRDPHSYQWSFTLEQEIARNMSLRASYIGAQSVGMPALADFNQVAPSDKPYSASRRPFQNWGRLNSIQNLGFASYQGLQLEVNRRLQNGWCFQGSYVLAKNLGTMGAAGRAPFLPPELNSFTVTDRYGTRYDRGDLDATRRHRFVLTGLFPLPFARSRIALLNSFFGGWELSTVTLLQSGVFQTPTMSPGLDQSNSNLAGRFVSARPDRIGSGIPPNASRDQYYDLTAFTPPTTGAGRLGNAGAGILQAPGSVVLSGGVSKTFRLTENARLRFEATFANLPNHPNFLPPSVNINDPNFGKLLFSAGGENTSSRSGQFGIRIDF